MKHLALFVSFLMAFQLAAQSPILTLEEAINQALSQNLGIKILRNDVDIAKTNAVRDAVGFAPTVNFVTGTTPSFGYVNQKFANGGEINRTNTSNNLTGAAQLTWTLYDGRRMNMELDRLKGVQAFSESQVRLRSEQIVYDVMRSYYNVVRQQELYKATADQLDLYEERLRLAQTRLDVGKGNQLDVLQAQSDLSVQKTQLTRQKQAIEIAKLQLNQVMSATPSVNFEIRDSLAVVKIPDYNILKSNVLNQNLSLELLQKQLNIANIVAAEATTLLKPRVTFNSTLNVGRQDNTAGFFLVNQNLGLNAGVTLIKPLYDAGNAKRQQHNAGLQIESVKSQTEQVKIDLVNALNLAYQSYVNAIEILRQEDDNRDIARRSIDIAMERFRLSRSTVLELKQIQQGYEAAILRAVTARFEAKSAEIEVLRLSGSLVR
jgi:outer membrane protein